MPNDMTGRLAELTKAAEQKRQNIDAMSNSWREGEGGDDVDLIVSSTEAKNFRKEIADLREIKGLIDDLTFADGVAGWLDAPRGEGKGNAAAETAAAAARGTEIKRLSDAFFGSDAYEEIKASGGKRLGGSVALNTSLYDFQQAKDLYSAQGGSISIPGFGSAQNLGLQPRVMRPGRVRDLFPSERTTAAILYGMRELGFTNNARVVPEREQPDGSAATGSGDVYGLKPMSQIDVQPVTYPIATIAHLHTAHRNVLADEPRLRSLLDADMIDGVKMAEDFEILYGDGTGENLTGILNTNGVQTYTGLASDRKSAQVRRAMTRAILAYYQPTGCVMHPLDWEDVELETDDNGAYRVAVSVALGGEKRLWRLNVVDTPAFTQGGFLLGAFGQAAKLFDREEVGVTISTEDSDNFRRNAVTIRAEERLALEVPRPESFVHGTFTTYAP